MRHAGGASGKPGASFAQLALRSQEFVAANGLTPLADRVVSAARASASCARLVMSSFRYARLRCADAVLA